MFTIRALRYFRKGDVLLFVITLYIYIDPYGVLHVVNIDTLRTNTYVTCA
jgi:hypothetical protein